jgi:hypothetical protein
VSLRAAVYYTVCAELASRQRPPPDLRVTLAMALGLPAEGNPQTVQQNRTICRQFLSALAIRLRADTPAFDFKWSALDDNLRTDTLDLLTERISENTKEIPAPEPALKAGANGGQAA